MTLNTVLDNKATECTLQNHINDDVQQFYTQLSLNFTVDKVSYMELDGNEGNYTQASFKQFSITKRILPPVPVSIGYMLQMKRIRYNDDCSWASTRRYIYIIIIYHY